MILIYTFGIFVFGSLVTGVVLLGIIEAKEQAKRADAVRKLRLPKRDIPMEFNLISAREESPSSNHSNE